MSRGALEHRAAKVSMVNGLSTFLSMAFQLISVPVCLRYWGKQEYGSWLALFSVVMLLRGLDGGYTVFVGNKLNYQYHTDIDALRRHLSSAVFGIVLIGTIQLMMAVGTLLFESWATGLGMPSDGDAGHAKFGLVVLMLSWVLTGSYLGIVHRLMIPAGLMYQSAWWAMAFQICQFASIMVAALMGMNLLGTALLFASSQLFIYVSSALYVRRALPSFTPWLQGARPGIGLRDLVHSLVLTLSNLLQLGATNGAVVLLSGLAGTVAVPVFTTTRTLANLWNSVTTILSTPLLPDVVRIHATGETQKLAAINQAYWVLVGSAVNFGATMSYPLIPWIYAHWTNHAVALDSALMCELLGSVVVSNVGALMALHLNGINSLRIVLGASVLRAAFALGGGALGFQYQGLSGFGIGILVGEIGATSLTTWYFIRRELASNGVVVRLEDLGPVMLSTGSTLSFLAGAAAGWWSFGGVWASTLVCVAFAALWGWNRLEPDLRRRLGGLPVSLFGTVTFR